MKFYTIFIVLPLTSVIYCYDDAKAIHAKCNKLRYSASICQVIKINFERIKRTGTTDDSETTSRARFQWNERINSMKME